MNETYALDRSGALTLAIILALFVLSGAAGLFDHRLFNGVSLWTKPIKFNLSFAIHVATLLVFVTLLRADVQRGRTIRLTMSITCTAVVLELAYINLQAARGRASHFNRETAWEEYAYYAMGAGVLIVMIGTLVIGTAVWRSARCEIGPGLRTGVGLGVVVGTFTTLLTAGAMSSMQFTSTGHWVGGALTDAGGLPILGWSMTGGDLRVPHFFATHLIQVIPVVGLLSDRFALAAPRMVVWFAVLSGLLLVWFTFEQALSGQPLLGSQINQ